jgi:hypothetical protein
MHMLGLSIELSIISSDYRAIIEGDHGKKMRPGAPAIALAPRSITWPHGGSADMKRVAAAAIITVFSIGGSILAQGGEPPPSPAGVSATQVGGTYVTVPGIVDPQYQAGKWIEIVYGRPIKRGRDLWGSGAD